MGQVEGWERRLLAVVAAWEGRPFVWGDSDCLRFCLACETAVSGSSNAVLLKYKTGTGAMRQIKRAGFSSLADAVSDYLQQIPVAAAKRGDWVMVEQDGPCKGACGVVLGRKAAFMSPSGLVYLPTLSASRAWSIR